MSKQKSKNKPIKSKKYSDNKKLNIVLLVLFSLFIIFFTTFKFSGDDDVFWHLATGRYIVENMTVPSQDVFGHQSEGQEWMPFEWGWDVLTYGIYSVSGYTGISVFRTIIFLLIFFVYYLIYHNLKIDLNVTILFFILISFGIIDRLTPRPHIVSLLFFVLLLLILVRIRYTEKPEHKLYFFIPVIFFVWGNMHMGVLAGLMLVGTFYCVTLYEKLKTGTKYSAGVNLRLMTIVFIISLLVLLVNPNGLATYIYAYEHTQMKMLETINEWRSPFDEMFSGSFVTNIYKLFLFTGIFVLYYTYKTKDVFPLILFIAFALYSVRAVRFTVDYIIIVSPFIALGMQKFTDSLSNENIKGFLKFGSFPKIILGLFLIFCIVRLPGNELYLNNLGYYRISGFGINNDFIPEQLFDFMKEHSVAEKGEKVLNHFGTGGFYVWNFPGKKNFIDSRNLSDEIFNDYNLVFTKRPGFEKRITELNADHVIYLAPDLVRMPQEMEGSIISYLSKNDEWKLVFWDDKSFLFLKNEDKFKDIIESFEYRYVTPYNFVYNKIKLEEGFTTDRERFMNELQRKKTEEPDGIIVNSVLQIYNIKF